MNAEQEEKAFEAADRAVAGLSFRNDRRGSYMAAVPREAEEAVRKALDTYASKIWSLRGEGKGLQVKLTAGRQSLIAEYRERYGIQVADDITPLRQGNAK